MLIKKNKIPIFKLLTVGILPSFLKKAYYRARGYKIGKGVSFSIGSVVIGEDVVIADHAKLGFISVVRGRKIRLGRFVRVGTMSMIDAGEILIDEDSRINENVIIGGTPTPESKLDIGKRVIVMQYSFINTTMPVTIGDDSGIGGHCLLFTHGSWLSQLDGFPVNFAPITIGKKVWLPWRVFIMPGVTIGDEVVIGANSMVNKSLPSNVLAAGSPAKVLKTDMPAKLSEQERADMIKSGLRDFAKHLEYNNLKITFTETAHGIALDVIKKAEKHTMILATDENYPLPANARVALFLSDGIGTPSTRQCQMILNTKEATRLGSSDLGEEFTQFISRYGIRFDRLD